ncbi:MAG: zinc-ribbon domain-containing protein [Pseudobutyrivibrio ruminis]|uniref:zinc ribbon domain-containing protein n=1 Tax=Pseudobutyrivibrio ruminis TaxID=46206 RepID=UPI0026E9D060|nr:zinc-ribbon domain-containing protein [Pseudobutyrivibrio ruminis]MBE5914880.1 zinc-ribbon domain-containing protein [Pseudobutyrivibrio ruminis]
MFCTKCGFELSATAKFCPKCGTPAKQPVAPAPQEAPVEEPVVEAAPEVEETPAEEPQVEEVQAEEPVEEVVEETVEEVSETEEAPEVEEIPVEENTEEVLTVDEVLSEQSAQAEEQPAAEAPVEQPTPEPAPQWSPIPPAEEAPAPKKGKKGIIIAIVVVVVIALLAVGGFFAYKFINNPAKMLSKAIDNQSGSLVEEYEVSYNSIQESYADLNGDMTLSVDFTLGDKIKSLLADEMGMTAADISWFNSAGATIAMDVQDESLGLDVDASINGTHITTFQALIDANAGEAYVSAPEIVSDASFIAGSDFDKQEIVEAIADYTTQLSTYAETYPTPAQMSTTADNYASIIKKDLAGADITKDKKEIKASGVKATYTELAITIDAKTDAQLTYDLAEAFEEDDDLKEMLMPFLEAEIQSDEYSEYADAEEYWNDITSDVSDAKKDAKKTLEKIEKNPKKNKDVGVLYVYLDSAFNIKGISYDDDAEGEVFTLYMPEDGADSGLKLKIVNTEGEALTIDGKGTSQDEFLNGTYTVALDDEEYFTIDVKNFDQKTYRKTRGVNAEFLVTLGEGMTESIYEDDMQFLALAQYDFVVQTEGTTGKIDMNVMADNDSLLQVNLSYSMEDVPDMAKAGTVYDLENMDGEEMIDLLKIVDLSSTVSNLEAAKVPSEYVEVLKTISETLKSGDDEAIYSLVLGLYGYDSYYDDSYYYDDYYYDDYYYDDYYDDDYYDDYYYEDESYDSFGWY